MCGPGGAGAAFAFVAFVVRVRCFLSLPVQRQGALVRGAGVSVVVPGRAQPVSARVFGFYVSIGVGVVVVVVVLVLVPLPLFLGTVAQSILLFAYSLFFSFVPKVLEVLWVDQWYCYAVQCHNLVVWTLWVIHLVLLFELVATDKIEKTC